MYYAFFVIVISLTFCYTCNFGWEDETLKILPSQMQARIMNDRKGAFFVPVTVQYEQPDYIPTV